ncbi:MAG TPA: hypothetical protein HPQ04_07750 [Rhodospirillaceae bacterium]|nr:hypothetical protein [Rhodospirillaceae bacterium]
MKPLPLAFAACLLASGAGAAELREFDAGAFERARSAGHLVMLIISSGQTLVEADLPWLVERLSDDDILADAQFFHLDFQRQRNQLAPFHVDRDGTVIVYRGRQERGRTIGPTDEGRLRRLLEGAR